MSNSTRRPVRVLFANCPHLDEQAAAYLVLAQNTFQTVFEFEVYHLSVYAEAVKLKTWQTWWLKKWADLPRWVPLQSYGARRWAAHLDCCAVPPLSKPLPFKTCGEALLPFVEQHNQWVEGLSRTYGGWTLRSGPTIIVTETAFDLRDYFGWGDSRVAIISVGNWHKRYAPPSVLEMILNNVQRYALRMAVTERIGSHYPTRACIWDFDANVADLKMSPLIGYLCAACESLLAEHLTTSQVQGIRSLLSGKWIGRVEKPGTVASNLKRVFGYDLTRTQGLKPGFVEGLRDAIPSEVLKLLGAVAAASVIGIGGFLLGLWWNTP